MREKNGNMEMENMKPPIAFGVGIQVCENFENIGTNRTFALPLTFKGISHE
jgi:hypothetical protein